MMSPLLGNGAGPVAWMPADQDPPVTGIPTIIRAHPDWVDAGCALASLIWRRSHSENRFPLIRDIRY
jgi:hypothetical protein